MNFNNIIIVFFMFEKKSAHLHRNKFFVKIAYLRPIGLIRNCFYSIMTDKAQLLRLFAQTFGTEATHIEPLQKNGSNRLYFRLSDVYGSVKVIGTIGTSREENEAFLYLDHHFTASGLPVPKVLAVSADGMTYLQEDLGGDNLFQLITSPDVKVNDDEKNRLLRLTLSTLPVFQFKNACKIDFSKCYPVSEFDRRTIYWDLNYFKYCFLKLTGVEFNEAKLEDEFELLARQLNCPELHGFMYRDFQSRNIMIKQGRPYFIDFQGGRKGPAHYDVASFLWQAKAGFSPQQRNEFIDVYLDSLNQMITVDKVKFKTQLPHFVLFRMLQVLGAYGYRGLWEKKTHFAQSIPAAIENAANIIWQHQLPYDYIGEIFSRLAEQYPTRKEDPDNRLTVKVYSFAYKNGVPPDDSGNGGGFVFDCRAVHNPGRHEQYKHLTGLDNDVAAYLEQQTEMPAFLDNVKNIVDASVEKYMSRNFTSLMVSFGCTGGQHRSVYAAQHLACHLHKKFNVLVKLFHREQDINQTLLPL